MRTAAHAESAHDIIMTDDGKLKRSVSLWRLVGIAFFTVAGRPTMISYYILLFCLLSCCQGGPYGIEQGIGAGGPLLAFAAMLALPLVYSAPMALMSAELSSLMPEAGSL